MDIVPLGPGFAAELRGVTLADVAADDAAYQAVRAAFEEHSVLVFRGQDVTDEAQLAFSRRFGPLEVTKVGSPGAGTHLVILTTIGRGRQGRAGRSSARAAQQGQSALAHRQHVQERAGARLGAVGAHHPGARRRDRIRLDPARLRAARSGVAQRSSKIRSPGTTMPIRAARSRPISRAPRSARRCRRNAGGMVWKNPANGRSALYIASHAYAIEGVENRAAQDAHRRADGRRRLRRASSYTHTWRQGDVVMWDNRATHASRPALAGARGARSWCAPRSRRPTADGLDGRGRNGMIIAEFFFPAYGSLGDRRPDCIRGRFAHPVRHGRAGHECRALADRRHRHRRAAS